MKRVILIAAMSLVSFAASASGPWGPVIHQRPPYYPGVSPMCLLLPWGLC